jgi:signal transduction histidine kinase
MYRFFGHDPARQDEEFRSEVERLARRGLLIAGWVEFGITGVTYLVRRYLAPAGEALPAWLNLPFIGLGILALLAWRTHGLRPHARTLSIVLALLTCACLSWIDVTACVYANGNSLAAVDILIVLLVFVAVVPATFLQALGFGLAVLAMHAAALAYGMSVGAIPRVDVTLPAVAISAVLCAILSGLNYGRLYQGHVAARSAVDAEARRAQSEYAATVSKLAAAMSHELNTPLGALRSAADSMAKASARHAVQPDARLVKVQADLAAAVEQSSARIAEVVTRMQRFANLDRADVQSADLRQVLEDVARVCECRAHIEIPAIPPVLIQPAVVGGLLATLMRRALERGETLRITARPLRDQVELRVELGASASLEPEFAVRDGRVGTSNWDLFHARQALQASGAGVRLEPSALLVSFPAAPRHSAAQA